MPEIQAGGMAPSVVMAEVGAVLTEFESVSFDLISKYDIWYRILQIWLFINVPWNITQFLFI